MKTDETRPSVLNDKITFLDVILIGSILALSTAMILKAKFDLNWPSVKTANAAVYQNGKLNQLLKLDEDREILLLDGKMIVEIRGKKIRVKQSDCPRQVCVHVGWISHPGEAVICVPYKTVIEIGAAGKPAVDAVVF